MRIKMTIWLVLATLVVLSVPALSQVYKDLIRGDAANPGKITLSDGSSNWLHIITGAQSADITLTTPTTDGDAGQVLRTDGSGVLSWIDSGAADTGLTANSVPYIGAGGILTQSAANIFWDATTNSNELTLGSGTAAGTLELLEGSGGGTNTVGITAPATLAADIEFVLPSTAIGDTGILFATAANTLGHEVANFYFNDTTNGNFLGLGAGTGGGTLSLLEGSGGGTNTVSITAPATLAADIEFTLPNALPGRAQAASIDTAGAFTYRPFKKVLYSATAASAAHTGATAAATTVMPATADDPEAIATSIGNANLAAGDVIEFFVVVTANADSPGDETLKVQVLFGSEIMGDTGAMAIDQSSHIFLRGTTKIRATGASGAGYTTWTAELVDSASGVPTASVLSTGDGQEFSSWDTTAAQAFIVQLDWGGTTAAGDTSTVQDVTVWHSAAD